MVSTTTERMSTPLDTPSGRSSKTMPKTPMTPLHEGEDRVTYAKLQGPHRENRPELRLPFTISKSLQIVSIHKTFQQHLKSAKGATLLELCGKKVESLEDVREILRYKLKKDQSRVQIKFTNKDMAGVEAIQNLKDPVQGAEPLISVIEEKDERPTEEETQTGEPEASEFHSAKSEEKEMTSPAKIEEEKTIEAVVEEVVDKIVTEVVQEIEGPSAEDVATEVVNEVIDDTIERQLAKELVRDVLEKVLGDICVINKLQADYEAQERAKEEVCDESKEVEEAEEEATREASPEVEEEVQEEGELSPESEPVQPTRMTMFEEVTKKIDDGKDSNSKNCGGKCMPGFKKTSFLGRMFGKNKKMPEN